MPSTSLNIVAVLLLMFFSFLFILFDKRKKSKLPPGPWRLPLIGSLHHLIGPLPHRTLANLAKQYGPVMYFKLGQVPTVVVSSPATAKQVLRTHDLAFCDRPRLTSVDIIFYDRKDIAFAPYGEYWSQMRKICAIELLSHKMVKSFSSIRKEELSSLVSSIRPGSVVNLTQKLLCFSSSVTCRSAFGKVCKDQEGFIKLANEVLEGTTGFDVTDLFPSWKLLHKMSGAKSRLAKVHHKVDAAAENIVNEHIKNRALGNKGNGVFGGEDLVDVLLRIKESGELPFPLTNDHVKAIIFDMFAAGTETSSSTIIWAISEMMKNPKIMAKAQSEVREAMKGKTSFDEEDFNKLSYLNLVIKETFRLHSPAPLLPRECREQTKIDGYTIFPKTRVVVNAWVLGRDPESWHNPESFNPERFKDSPVDFMGNHFELLPFGAGKRICPGMQFGLANVVHPLIQLLYHFNWELPRGTSLDMYEKKGLVASKQNDLCLIATVYRDGGEV